MRALLPVFSTMLRFSPGDVARCQESAAKWEAAAGKPFEGFRALSFRGGAAQTCL